MSERAKNSWRIGVGGFSHETNSFSSWPTQLDDFSPPNGGILRGRDEMGERLASDCPAAGFVAEVERLKHEAVPVLDAYATPSGTITRDTYQTISEQLVEGLLKVEDADAFLVSLHGAAEAEGCDDPEGDIVARLRAARPDCRIGIVLDHHAGVSDALVEAADVIVGFKTEPHIDTAECGAKAARVVVRLLSGDIKRIDSCLIRLPILLPIENLRTTEGPLHQIMAVAHGLEQAQSDRVIDISVFPGFAYSDKPATSASVLVQTNADPDLAASLATQITETFWTHRQEFYVSVESSREAVMRALAAIDTPVVLIDKADHPGAGGVGDCSLLLRLLHQLGATDTVVAPIHDPKSVAHATAVGVGESARFRIGGRLTGEPYEVTAKVRLLADGTFEALGPVDHGARLSTGKTAVLELDGIEVVVCEARAGLQDPEMLRRLGIEPTRKRIIAMKALGTFRAAFESIMGEGIMVDAEGPAPHDVTTLPFRRVARPIEPIDRVVEFDPTATTVMVRGRTSQPGQSP
jgi:microcystin degradation protein MlrC